MNRTYYRSPQQKNQCQWNVTSSLINLVITLAINPFLVMAFGVLGSVQSDAETQRQEAKSLLLRS